MKFILLAFLLATPLMAGNSCPVDSVARRITMKVNRPTARTHHKSVVRVSFECSGCTGWVIKKNYVMGASHCLGKVPGSMEVVVKYINGGTSKGVIVKYTDYETDIGWPNDILLIKTNTGHTPPLKLAKTSEVGKCFSYGYGMDHIQKRVRCENFGPGHDSDGMDVLRGDIDHGDSGGPIVNLKNEVIGMNEALSNLSRTVFYSIPVEFIHKFMNEGYRVKATPAPKPTKR